MAKELHRLTDGTEWVSWERKDRLVALCAKLGVELPAEMRDEYNITGWALHHFLHANHGATMVQSFKIYSVADDRTIDLATIEATSVEELAAEFQVYGIDYEVNESDFGY